MTSATRDFCTVFDEQYALNKDRFYEPLTKDERWALVYITEWIIADNVEVPLNLTKYNLRTLPHLPSNLRYLKCGTIHRAVFPPALVTLECWHSNEECDMPALPSTLTHLTCKGNITGLPALPPNMVHLDCHLTRISKLPELPSTLLYLNCNNTKITTLPNLSATLQILICSNTRITELPPLPDTLQHLEVSVTDLTRLPLPLPAGLQYLACCSMKYLTGPFPDFSHIKTCKRSSIEYQFNLAENVSISAVEKLFGKPYTTGDVKWEKRNYCRTAGYDSSDYDEEINGICKIVGSSSKYMVFKNSNYTVRVYYDNKTKCARYMFVEILIDYTRQFQEFLDLCAPFLKDKTPVRIDYC